MLNKIFSMSLLFYCFTAAASVEIDSSIYDVFNRGTDELAGSLTFTVNGDDFREVSPASPIFIRVALDHNALLGETLVKQDEVGSISQPIDLALRMNTGITTARCVADPDAVRIVRWVEGENSFWMGVFQSSNEWIDTGKGPQGPSSGLEVTWTIGIPARLSDSLNDMDAFQGSNLPFDTRDNSAVEKEYTKAISTLLCVDLSQSNLSADGTGESLLSLDVIAFDDGADLGNGEYSSQTGNQVGINFSIPILARGKTYQCSVDENQAPSTYANDNIDGLLSITKPFSYILGCETGGNFLDTNLVTGSYVRLQVNTAQAGFPATDAASFNDFVGFAEVVPESAIEVDGVTLYREVRLTYDDVLRPLNNFLTVNFEADIRHAASQNGPFQVDLDLVLMSHDRYLDEEPYTGEEQNLRCVPYALPVGFFGIEFSAPPSFNTCLAQWPEHNVPELLILSLPGPVSKTGQTQSFANGDDGYLQTGLPLSGPRFTDNGDGTVTDNHTGLIWSKQTACETGSWTFANFLANNLESGDCGINDGSVPGDWRLPTIRELRSLLNLGYSNPAISNAAGDGPALEGNPFVGIEGLAVWTSTTNPAATDSALFVDFSDGSSNSIGKGTEITLWPVRSPSTSCRSLAAVAATGQTEKYTNGDNGQLQTGTHLPSPRFVDRGDGTVYDRLTGLLWTRAADCALAQDWVDALHFAANLSDGSCGLSDGSAPGDWRLPSINELHSLTDMDGTPVISNTDGSDRWAEGDPFTGLQDAYWSSSSAADSTLSRLILDITSGQILAGNPSIAAWAVRGMAYPLSR